MAEPQVDVLERFFGAMRAGDLQGWMSQVCDRMRRELETGLPTEEEQRAFLAHQQAKAPVSFEVVDEQEAGEPGMVQLLVRARLPDEGEERVTVSFLEENGEWRIGGLYKVAG